VHLESDLLIINYHSVFKTFSPKCQCKPNFAALCIKKNTDIIFKINVWFHWRVFLKKCSQRPPPDALRKKNYLVGLPQNKNFCSSVFLSVSDVFRWKNYDEKNLKKIKNYYKKILWVLSNWWQHTPLYDSILMTILYLYVWWSFLLSVLLKQNPRIHIWIFQNENNNNR